MKLYNRTKIPDGIVAAVLKKAGVAVGARTAKVIVCVNQGRTPHSHGLAHEGTWYKFRPAKGQRIRKVTTDGGIFKITMPEARPPELNVDGYFSAETCAERFFQVARHEWGHIRDFQTGGRRRHEFSKPKNGRRPKHSTRPEEIRTYNYSYDADQKGMGVKWASDEIAALASAINNVRSL